MTGSAPCTTLAPVKPGPPIAATLFTALLALAALLTAWNTTRDPTTGGDLYLQPYLVPRAVAALHLTDVYSPRPTLAMGRWGLKKASHSDATPSERTVAHIVFLPSHPVVPTTGTPFFFAVFSLFGRCDFETFLRTYVALSLLLFAASMLAAAWLLGLEPATALGMIALAPWLCAIRSELHIVNVNLLEMGIVMGATCLLAAERLPGSAFLAGAVFALGVMFKPNIALAGVLLAVGWVADRKYPRLAMAIAGAAAGGATAFALSCLYFGTAACWIPYISSASALMHDPCNVSSGNYSVTRQVMDLMGMNVSAYILVALTLLAAIGIWRSRVRGGQSAAQARQREYLAAWLGIAVGVIASPIAWLHYYVLLIPLALYAFRPLGATDDFARTKLRQMLLLMASLALLIQLQPMHELLSISHSALTSARVHILASFALLGVGIVELYSTPSTCEPSSADPVRHAILDPVG